MDFWSPYSRQSAGSGVKELIAGGLLGLRDWLEVPNDPVDPKEDDTKEDVARLPE